jgi:hypothetical protein
MSQVNFNSARAHERVENFKPDFCATASPGND